MAKPSLYCGIDLGTTNSTVSVIQIEKRTDEPMEKLHPVPIYQYDENFHFDKDEIELPSALYFDLDRNQVYTGKYAKKMYSSGERPMQTIRSVKTRIGGESMVEIPKINNSQDVSYFDMTECSALFLRTIRQSLNQQFNLEVEEAVVTVPAAFNNDERQATRNAIWLAGFKGCWILDEPSASLLYYINGGEGDLFEDNISGDGEYKLVYDIGGGTLDVSIAKITEDDEGDIEIDIAARSPRMDLGGDDFDQYLAAYFLSEFEKARKSIEDRPVKDQNRVIARIVSEAEEYKIKMNSAIKEKFNNPEKLKKVKKEVAFEVVSGMYIQDIDLTKDILDTIFSELINKDILEPVKKSLKYAGIEKSQISEVLITGGMSNFYAVEESLRRFFGNDTRLLSIDTVTSVSKGAVIHHYNKYNEGLKKLKIKDRLADDVFIKIGKEFKMFLSRNTKTDQEGIFEYEITENGFADIPIFLYYGTDDKPEHYTPLSGKIIPLNRPFKKGEKIKLKWNLDKDKIITINVFELNEELKIEKNKNFTSEQFKNIKRLKIN